MHCFKRIEACWLNISTSAIFGAFFKSVSDLLLHSLLQNSKFIHSNFIVQMSVTISINVASVIGRKVLENAHDLFICVLWDRFQHSLILWLIKFNCRLVGNTHPTRTFSCKMLQRWDHIARTVKFHQTSQTLHLI